MLSTHTLLVPQHPRWQRFAIATSALALTFFVAACQTDTSATPSSTSPPETSPAAAPPDGTPTPPAPDASPSPSGAIVVAPLFVDYSGGGGNNIVHVANHDDGRLRVGARADYNRISGPNVSPVNSARAESSCTDCQTIAVALQVGVYQRGSPRVAPQNQAVAINTGCTRCVTVARAIQYLIPVDDVKDVPDDVRALVQDIDREMRYFEGLRDVQRVDLAEADAHFSSLIAKYQRLQQYLSDLVDVKEESAGTPSPTPTGSPTADGTATPSPTPTSGSAITPTATQASTATPSPPASSTPTPEVGTAISTMPAATATPTLTPSPTPEPLPPSTGAY